MSRGSSRVRVATALALAFALSSVVGCRAKKQPSNDRTDVAAHEPSTQSAPIASPPPPPNPPKEPARTVVELGPLGPAARGFEVSVEKIAVIDDEVRVAWSAIVEHGDKDNIADAELTAYSARRPTPAAPRRLTKLPSRPLGLIVHDKRIYWGTKDGIWSMPLAGGKSTKLSARRGAVVGHAKKEIIVEDGRELVALSTHERTTKERTIGQIPIGIHGSVVTATHYYAAVFSDSKWPRKLLRISLSDGAEQWIATNPPANFVYGKLATNGSDVVVSLKDATHRIGGPGAIYSVDREAIIVNTEGEATPLAVGKKWVYFTVDRATPKTTVRIERVPLAGGAIEPVAQPTALPVTAALGNGHLVWATHSRVESVTTAD